MSREWYEKHHISKETEEFNKWWLILYGTADDYSEEDVEQDEYWVRKAFSLLGWNAREKSQQDNDMNLEKEKDTERYIEDLEKRAPSSNSDLTGLLCATIGYQTTLETEFFITGRDACGLIIGVELNDDGNPVLKIKVRPDCHHFIVGGKSDMDELIRTMRLISDAAFGA